MPSTRLRIATYNIRKALGTDRRRDPQRILRIVRDLRADIVMLQEADRRWSPRPSALPRERIRAATGMVAVDLGDGGPSLGAHGNAILVNPSFAVERVAAVDLPGFEPRGMLAARLALPDGRGVWAIGVHLGLLRASRRRQLAALGAWLDAQGAGKEPVIVAGDFNERSGERGLEPLETRLCVLPPQATYHARHPLWPLDRIAASAHFEAGESRVVRDWRTRDASDHLPLVADLEWADPASSSAKAGDPPVDRF